MNTLASTALELARWQFALTTLFHFIFVPLTLGLAPLLAVMQTLWHRTGDEKWLRLTRFFGTLFVINFAIGVATGLVMEFQFGMNWSAFSTYVGDVFGTPLAIEGHRARSCSRRPSSASGSSAGTGSRRGCISRRSTWSGSGPGSRRTSSSRRTPGCSTRSATRSTSRPGRAEANDIVEILFQGFVLFAWTHAILAGLVTASFFVLGVSCWHLLRGRNVDVFRARRSSRSSSCCRSRSSSSASGASSASPSPTRSR